MKLSNVKLILAREVRDQLRDRRTLFVIAVLPILLYPLLGMSMLQMSQFVQSRPVRVLVVGGRGMEVSPPLIEGDRFAEWLFANPKDAEKLQLVFDADGDRPPDGPDNLKQPIAAGGQDQSASWEKARALVQSGAYEAAIYFPPDFADRLQELHDSIAERRAALAAVVGVLVEVPVMLMLVRIANATRRHFPEATADVAA